MGPLLCQVAGSVEAGSIETGLIEAVEAMRLDRSETGPLGSDGLMSPGIG